MFILGVTMRDSIVWYRSFMEAVEELPAEDFKRCVMTILKYGLDGEIPQTNGIEKTIYIMAKPQLDKNYQKWVNGKSGGRPKTKEEPNDNQSKTKKKPNNNLTETKPEPNVNVNANDNENVNVNANVLDNETDILTYQEVLAIAKEECPMVFKRHSDKVDGRADMFTVNKVMSVIDQLNGTYTYQQLRELFKKANKMYIVQPKYASCDLLWLLNNLRKVESATVETPLTEENNSDKRVSGYKLYACDIGEVDI